MKALFKFAAMVFLVLVPSCSSMKTTPETMRKLALKVQAKDFTVVVNYADPMRMRQRYLDSEYDLRIKNDSAFAYLPYFGVAYSAPYPGGEGGIKFAEPMEGYSMKSNRKKNGWDISFKVKGKEEAYHVYMNVFNNGSSTIVVNSYNRDAITFIGEVSKP